MASEENLQDLVSVTVKWSGKEYIVRNIAQDATVLQLKERVCQVTGVKPERQKLLGLKCKGTKAHLYLGVTHCRHSHS